MNRPASCLAAALALAALLTACGSGAGAGNPESKATDYDRALDGAPPALRDLYAQGNEILPGGPAAYEDRLAELRGHPVVVNKWASWCGPCRAEFPFFQSQAAKRGEEIAFLGVNTYDEEGAARTFLEQLPVPYPSYADPDRKIEAVLEATEFPATAFYDSGGELVYVHRGGYQDEADLVADIDRYAR